MRACAEVAPPLSALQSWLPAPGEQPPSRRHGAIDERTAAITERTCWRRDDPHGGVGLEHQNCAGGIQREIDGGVVERTRLADAPERRHRIARLPMTASGFAR